MIMWCLRLACEREKIQTHTPWHRKNDFVARVRYTHRSGDERQVAPRGESHVVDIQVSVFPVYSTHLVNQGCTQRRLSVPLGVSKARWRGCCGAQRLLYDFWRRNSWYALRHVQNRALGSWQVSTSPFICARNSENLQISWLVSPLERNRNYGGAIVVRTAREALKPKEDDMAR